MSHTPNMKTLVVIGLVSSLGVFGGSLLAPIEVRYIQQFSAHPMVIGGVFAFGSLFFALLSYWIGRYSDTAGRKYTILLGLLFGLVYALLYSMVVNIMQVYGVKMAWAVSAVATGPVVAAYLQDFLEPYKQKGRYFGYIYSAQSISGSLGALLGGYVAERFGLETPLYLLALVYFLLICVVSIAFPKHRASPKEEGGEVREKKSIARTLSYILSKPALLFYLSVNTSFSINWGIKVFLWPLIIFEMAQSDVVTGSIFATMGAVAFLLLPFAGRVVDRFGSYRVMLIELFVLGCAGLGMVVAQEVWFFWICAALYTIGEVLNGPAQAVLLTEQSESHIRGEIMGLDAAMDQFLAVLSPLLAGLLILLVGLKMTLLVFILLFWVSLALSTRIYLRRIII